ncbi:MAG: porin [Salaquimonas sp.]|jgi:hypothetical protein|nr:porin [Salaquimonas sp.]
MKSLFLASAILLAVANNARASDQVFVESEPTENLKPCDTYGAGWYYLPGTKTCVKMNGDTRIQYGSVHFHDGKNKD